ncbi:MAG: hypothetical protein TREMPRED_000919 [Tremellales sp. Tagirdzhanova-0007]|nr:MAG: hypothetical protein TREMPRED_000919 [Tremellales sp. Tagirdzhanova-0007]
MSARTALTRAPALSRLCLRSVNGNRQARKPSSIVLRTSFCPTYAQTRSNSSTSTSSWTDRLFGSSKPKYAPGEFAKDPIITYDELLPITEQPSDDIFLVDVREPDEVQSGMIPSATNLPLSDIKDALDPKTAEGDFFRKFSFRKPLPDQNIIFYCRSGKRSAAAAELAGERGFKNVRNYRGSWLDWTRRSKGKDDEED